jgi:hypothetical protein
MTSHTDGPMTITCGQHGERVAAVVCRHHLKIKDRAVGFVENSDDPNDRQAWCDDCEEFFLREGEMTEDFREFNDFAIVCIDCYMELRGKHARQSSDDLRLQE